MPLQEHVDTLRMKHARLEQLIAEELHRPLPDQSVLTRWKREKLRLKEEIERSHMSGKVAALANGAALN
jgi:hypothetical protein